LAASQVKVVLAGDGGDELYCGYGRYRWAKRLERYGAFLRWTAPLLQASPTSRFKRVGDLLALPSTARPEHIFSQEEYAFSWAEIRKLYPYAASTPWQTPFALPADASAAQAAWDFLHYLPDDLLTKVDRASMQHSLEVRVPLLDKRWVALSWRIPSLYKAPLSGKPPQYKPLLRQVLKKYLPASLVERRKWGFTLPMADWLRGPLYDWARAYAAPEKLHAAYDLIPTFVQQLWERFLAGEAHLAKRLWLLTQIGQYGS
jgi:asparagine synthase (glutamine-hydrolysing)